MGWPWSLRVCAISDIDRMAVHPARPTKNPSMLLVIDIGNTNIVLGIFQGTALEHSWRISTSRNRTVDEYASLCDHLFHMAGVRMDRVEDIAVCSVVPPLNDCFKVLSQRYIGREPLMVDPVGQSLLPIRYQPKSDVGADRVANSLATLDLVGAPAIAVDFGTATTFDAISARGEYVGGVIAAGIGISAEALFSRTAKLPRIEIARPGKVVGTSTGGSIQSGLYHGYVGLVEGILKRMKEELGGARVVATGGLAPLIAGASEGIDLIEENLTLYGLRIYHERLAGRRSREGKSPSQ